MPDQDYLPRADAEFLNWHDRMLEAVQQYGSKLGIPATEQAQVLATNQAFHSHIATVTDTAAKAAAAVAAKDTFRQQLERECRALARRVKAHPNYASSLGVSFGIVSRRPELDPVNLQPALDAQAKPSGEVSIAYTKASTDGINVYGKYPGAVEWTLLGRSTRSPFVDRRPPREPGVAEEREYRALYVVADEQIGQWSGVITITTRPA
jgi:hypothetical protein